MVAVISFLAMILLSLTVVRIATVMLRLTGLSRDIAQFQARSAFTTTGFTAQESEVIMNHPVRRKIIQNLMLLGNIGFVSFISSFMLTVLADNDQYSVEIRLGIGVAGTLVLFILSRLRIFDSAISWLVTKAFARTTRLYRKDYDSLLFLAKDFEIVKGLVKAGTWLADRPLKEFRLSDEGILIIGIRRTDGYFIGSPRGDSVVYVGDEIILYGREEALADLFDRPTGAAGDMEHKSNIEKQRRLEGRIPVDPKTLSNSADLKGGLLKNFRRRRSSRT